MFLHLGQDTTVLTEDLIGIFDLDTCTISAKTREFLARAEKDGRVVNTSEDLPKSFAVGAGEKPAVFICQNAPATIKKRWAEWEENTRKNHKKMV